MDCSANSAFLFAAQNLCAAQPTQVRRTFASELNADIEDNLSTLGFSPYKYPTNLALECIPFAVYQHLTHSQSHSLKARSLGRSSSSREGLGVLISKYLEGSSNEVLAKSSHNKQKNHQITKGNSAEIPVELFIQILEKYQV